MWLGEFQSQRGRFRKAGIKPWFLCHLSRSLVTTLTELSRHPSIRLSTSLYFCLPYYLHVSLYLTHYCMHTPIQMSVLFTLQFMLCCFPLYFYLAYHMRLTLAALCWSSWSGSRPELKYWGTWCGSCLCLWHCANSPREPLLATLPLYHPTSFQFVIRIYHHGEAPGYLFFLSSRDFIFFPNWFHFSSFRLSCPSLFFLCNFLSELILYFLFDTPFLLFLFLYFLFNYNFTSVFL
jgi:hypothetical protein